LSPSDLLSCFVSGLKPELRREVLAQQPVTLSQAAGLARLQEEKVQDLLRLARSKPPWFSTPQPSSRPIPPAPPHSSSTPLLPTPGIKPCFRQLSESELAVSVGYASIVMSVSLGTTVAREGYCSLLQMMTQISS